MRRLNTLILLLFLAFSTWGQEYKKIEDVSLPKKYSVNFGIKAGFNSSMYTVSKFKIGDVTIDDTQNNYKIGYFGSAFIRINMGDHYLQPEASFQLSRCQVTFDKLGSQHPELDPDYAAVTSKLHSIDIPLLYGYSIINRKPIYGLSVFAGPKFKYLWNKKNKINFENFDQELEEELRPISMSLTAGVAVNISNIFFDFRYDHGLSNISKSINYASTDQPSKSDIIFKRVEHVLSFSIGMMF